MTKQIIAVTFLVLAGKPTKEIKSIKIVDEISKIEPCVLPNKCKVDFEPCIWPNPCRN